MTNLTPQSRFWSFSMISSDFGFCGGVVCRKNMVFGGKSCLFHNFWQQFRGTSPEVPVKIRIFGPKKPARGPQLIQKKNKQHGKTRKKNFRKFFFFSKKKFSPKIPSPKKSAKNDPKCSKKILAGPDPGRGRFWGKKGRKGPRSPRRTLRDHLGTTRGNHPDPDLNPGQPRKSHFFYDTPLQPIRSVFIIFSKRQQKYPRILMPLCCFWLYTMLAFSCPLSWLAQQFHARLHTAFPTVLAHAAKRASTRFSTLRSGVSLTTNAHTHTHIRTFACSKGLDLPPGL